MKPRPIKYLTLIVTDQCNLSCRYCYRGKAGQGTLDLEHAVEAINLAALSGEPFHVQITGGEPLLAWERVQEIIGYIREVQIKASVGIQTNGTLLDGDMARFFGENSVQVGVSLDGPPKVHDYLRGRAALTLKGMKALSSNRVPVRTTTVVTRENVDSLGQIPMMLGVFPTAAGMALDLLVSKGAQPGSGILPANPQDLSRGIQSLWNSLAYVNSKRPIPMALREAETLAFNMNHGKRSLYCHAQKGHSMAVAPGGKVYPCGQTAGDRDFFKGLLSDFPRPPVCASLIKEALYQECQHCQAREVCPGDCPSRLHYNKQPGSPLSCVVTRTLYELMHGKIEARKAG